MVNRQYLSKLLNSIKRKKKYIITLYSKTVYGITVALKKYSIIKSIYIIGKWLLIYFSDGKNFILKIFNLKNRSSTFSYEQLRKKKYLKGIVFCSKGAFSIEKALELKQGGILLCLIYFFN